MRRWRETRRDLGGGDLRTYRAGTGDTCQQTRTTCVQTGSVRGRAKTDLGRILGELAGLELRARDSDGSQRTVREGEQTAQRREHRAARRGQTAQT